MKMLIKNSKIFTAFDSYTGDIFIEDGVIKELGTNLNKDCDKLIDTKNKIVIPGGVDVHTHFNLHVGKVVANDDFYSGTISAACGGTTCIVDHIGFGPENCDLDYPINVYHKYAENNAVIDYSFHGVLQNANEKTLSQMKYVINAGIPSFKTYLTYDYKASDLELYKTLNKIREVNGLLTVHAENDDIINYLRKYYRENGNRKPIYHALSRPIECEAEAVNKVIMLAKMANAPVYIVHLTNELSLKAVVDARKLDQNVYAETCPQYLLLDDDRYKLPNGEGLKYILSPPLRNKIHQKALWNGLKDGNIQVIATDHCPFSFATDKQLGKDDFTKCPNGIGGVEERIPLIFSEGVMKGRISIKKFVEVCSMNPAKLFGLYPRKGTIDVGSDADIVIIDPEKEVILNKDMLHSRADYTAYEDFKLKGYPIMTISRGKIIARNNEFIGDKGWGRFMKRKPFVLN